MSVATRLFLMISLVLSGSLAFAGPVPNSVVVVPQSIPAVSQAGLIALAFIVGLVGANLIRKSKATKS
jgi:hypothetical protein